jgi:hypothetical protein
VNANFYEKKQSIPQRIDCCGIFTAADRGSHDLSHVSASSRVAALSYHIFVPDASEACSEFFAWLPAFLSAPARLPAESGHAII